MICVTNFSLKCAKYVNLKVAACADCSTQESHEGFSLRATEPQYFHQYGSSDFKSTCKKGLNYMDFYSIQDRKEKKIKHYHGRIFLWDPFIFTSFSKPSGSEQSC